MVTHILNNIKENYDYYGVIFVCISASLVIIKYRLYLEDLEKNKKLENNYDLINYASEYLDRIFNTRNFFELNDDFLNNYYLYNFFLNFAKIIPQISSIFFDINYEENFIINEFFEFLKTNPTFSEFKEYRINKKIFFNITQSIKKNLFFMGM